jgi:gamma-glutamyl-gamma-aminobutyrate hydrolase PuuD
MKKIWIIVGYNKDNFIDQLPLSYIKALEENNKFLCYLIPSISRNIDDYILKLDWFLIPWWDSDVDSTLYWEQYKWRNLTNLNSDKSIIAVIKKIIKYKKPMLWICKWMQLINVSLWGSLIQNIPDVKYSFDYVENVSINKESKLFKIYKKELLKINSIHSQCVKRVWKWLYISAHNDKWFIEAIENKEWTILCVQWHPEYLKDHIKLFTEFYD